MTTPQNSSEDYDNQPIAITLEDLSEAVSKGELVVEHHATFWKKEDLEKYKDEVFQFLVDGYKAKGAPLGVNSPDRLAAETDHWQLCRENGKIIAAFCRSRKGGGLKTRYGCCLPTIGCKQYRQCVSSGPVCAERMDGP